jgi:methionyl-tRNA synthetase
MTNITIDQFKELDIRIGTVVKAEVPSWSHWVMKMTVDIGPIEADTSTSSGRSGRQKNTIVVFAGITHFYKVEELEGKQFPFIVNLEKKKIGPEGDFSEGMMLAADLKIDKPVKIGDEEIFDKPLLFSLSEIVPNGTKVM